MERPPDMTEYRCPGEKHPISRAVHLGRLAAFYPACRTCPHREDTETLSQRQIDQLQEVQAARQPLPLFHNEGAGGVYRNDLTPAAARNLAAAFGAALKGRAGGAEGGISTVGHQEFNQSAPPSSLIHHPSPNPLVLLGGDGRSITAELSAAACEGLCLSGCDAADIGPATAACLGFAMHRFHAAGGLLVGNSGRQPQRVDIQFWAAAPQPSPLLADAQISSPPMPLSAAQLDPIAERYPSDVGRPTCRYGALRREQAAAPYLAALSEYYHALRPLRIVVDSASRPLIEYLQKLAAAVACEILPSQDSQQTLPEQLRAAAGHLAVRTDGDGETCEVFDERGEPVAAERLLLLLAQSLDPSQRRIVLEAEASPAAADRLASLGVGIVAGGPSRADMAAAMCRHDAALGQGPGSRFWHRLGGVPLPDALLTVTRLLKILSRSDAPLSAVLDREAPLG